MLQRVIPKCVIKLIVFTSEVIPGFLFLILQYEDIVSVRYVSAL